MNHVPVKVFNQARITGQIGPTEARSLKKSTVSERRLFLLGICVNVMLNKLDAMLTNCQPIRLLEQGC